MDKMVIHIEAEQGSSQLDFRIENADAAQLFAAAGIIQANANVALAAQMQNAAAKRSPIDIVKGSLPS